MNTNPLLRADFPDPDVIRVDDCYYMVSTSMHFMPGAPILRSFDLRNWEIACYVYDVLEPTGARALADGEGIYGQGMWAASLRNHQNKFYLVFSCKDNRSTYLYTADNIAGPWTRRTIEGFYHDASLIFDDDGRVYLVHGNTDIRLTELATDLSGPMPSGVDRVIFRDRAKLGLGYEGAHVQKIQGRYYISLIHWPTDGSRRRMQAVMAAEAIEGPYTGKDVLDDDMGYFNNGVAQGGLVDTPQGDWYAILFQDRGAVGRVPVLVPVRWENAFPVLGIDGKVPANIQTVASRPDYHYEPLVFSDDFRYKPDADGRIRLRKGWEWNHMPDDALWSVDGKRGVFELVSGRVVNNLVQARNTLTMRSVEPGCSASVRVDGSGLKDGDVAGICALQGKYGLVGLTKEADGYSLVMLEKPGEADYSMGGPVDSQPPVERGRVRISGPQAQLKITLNFANKIDEAEFFYKDGQTWKKLGITKKLYFGLDHFCGVRFGLFLYSTRDVGGSAEFREFTYEITDVHQA